MIRKTEGLIIPSETGLIPVEGLEFDHAIVPCALNFNKATAHALARLSITTDYQRAAFFGEVDAPNMRHTAKGLVKSLGDNDEEIVDLVSEAIVDLTQEAAETTGDEAVWLELRAGAQSHPFYDVPRWHSDGTFFDPFPKQALYKFATTLVGPGTRLGITPDREKFMETLFSHPDSQSASPEGVRSRIELGLDALVDEFPVSELGDAAFFLVGHDKAVIHSEPPATGPRLFMFTLGGPLEKIEALGGRRKDG